MADQLKFYINGEWVDPLGSETIEVINPSDESIIGSISAGTKEDIDIAVRAAKEAFKTFAFSSKEERIELIKRIISEYEKRSEELAKTISSEMGAPLWLSNVAQVTSGLSHFKDTLEVLKTFEFEGTENNYLVRKEPIGVIGMITPWNWPMNQMCTKVASAIASGCTMVLKPSEITPFCGIIFAEILDAAKVPAGVFNLVNGMGPIVGAALSEHRDIDMMHFTGSTRAGVAVAIASAPTVKRVAQELGGKSANIILDDADIEKAAAAGANHCFMNTGQSCNAPTRMLVSSNNYEKAVEAAADFANSTVVGSPEEEGVKISTFYNSPEHDIIKKDGSWIYRNTARAGNMMLTKEHMFEMLPIDENLYSETKTDKDYCAWFAGLCRRSLPGQRQSGAIDDIVPYGDRNPVDGHTGYHPRRDRHPVLPVALLSRQDGGHRHGDQGHWQPVVLEL